jgi:hypothetical protein
MFPEVGPWWNMEHHFLRLLILRQRLAKNLSKIEKA